MVYYLNDEDIDLMLEETLSSEGWHRYRHPMIGDAMALRLKNGKAVFYSMNDFEEIRKKKAERMKRWPL